MVTKFNEFVAEAENKKPYKLVILSHDDPEDPNITGQRLEEEAKKMKKDDIIIMNMCGRGDKDLSAVLPKLKAMGKI